MRRDELLSVRQIRVLKWIGDGCPEGVWSDFTYKTTGYALAARGLVEVVRRRDRWSAAITEDGQFYWRTAATPQIRRRSGRGRHRARLILMRMFWLPSCSC